MKKKGQNDIFSLFIEFQKNTLDSRPTREGMFKELQMMKFKIRPLQGDISLLNLKDKHLIEVLWNLGKLDDFFRQKYDKLNQDQKKTFFSLFDNLHQKYQNELNSLNLKSGEDLDVANIDSIEMEIFKEELPKKRIN